MLPNRALAIVLIFFVGVAQANDRPVLRSHEALALSRDGKHIADVEALDPGNLPDEAHGAVVIRTGDGKPVAQFDPCATCKYGDTAWSPAKDTLAFIAADSAAGTATLYVVENGALRKVTQIEGVANTTRWSADGTRIAVLATVGAHKKTGATEAGAAQVGDIGTAPDEQRIATVAASGGEITLVSPADTYIYEFDWMPDGSGFVATGAKGSGDDNWWVAVLVHVDARSGALRTIAAPAMQLNLPRVSPDGKTVAFIGGLMSDWGAIGGDVYTVPVAGGTSRNLTPDFRGSFRGIAWTGARLTTAALIDDHYAVVTLDPKTSVTKTLWSAPVDAKAQRFDGAIAFTADGSTAAAIFEDFNQASEIAAGRLPRLARVTRDNAVLPGNVSAQSVHWTNEGFHVQGWLLGPKQRSDDSKHPMVVMVHGGPSSALTPRYISAGAQYGTNFDFVNDLIERGYYIFYPNPRGSYGQGEAFTRANIRDFGRGDLRDILAGIDAVEKIAPVDDARLGVFGHSYGGWMTMWANTQTRRFKAAVAGAGIANWTSYYGQNGIDQWMIPFFGASVYDDPAVYRAASPIEFIKQAKTPTLIYVGERDVECPPAQSLEYWHALKAIGTETQLIIYAGEGHHFDKPADVADLRARINAWYARYLE